MPDEPARPTGPDRKAVLLRLDPALHEALTRWAADELRSTNAQVELLIREALRRHGWLPKEAQAPRGRGRPPKER
ncbi:hypothetical protein [Flexivirga caeni]|uniref:Toxin-antitoxin system HicB family antitoxin n=1 Tax=Flexivirga caeni TaxID=2294115 RepID=A0A3M9M404_9MICO|nr:hypothetical protein [Flexivirga caeni]RNI20270.1 hypothetical protein EFY87_15055 [Flexivirga caeni]